MGRETRQAVKNIIDSEAEPVKSIQAELETAVHETAQALEQEEITQVDAKNNPTQEH